MKRKSLLPYKEQLDEARANLYLARQNFNYATPEYFEVANLELTVAELKFRAINQEIRNFYKKSQK